MTYFIPFYCFMATAATMATFTYIKSRSKSDKTWAKIVAAVVVGAFWPLFIVLKLFQLLHKI